MAKEALLPVLRGELPLKIHAHRADDILTAIRIAEEFHLRFSLEHCTEGYLIPEAIRQAQDAGAKVIIGPLLTDRSKVELRNLTFQAPKLLHDQGIEFALMTDHPVVPLQYLPVCAALAVREGLDEDTALKAITLHGARAVGLEDRLGSLEPGKDGDVAIFRGHPLDVRSRCVMTRSTGRSSMTSDSLQEEKAALRRQMRHGSSGPAPEQARAELPVGQPFLPTCLGFQAAGCILAYMAMPGE